MFKVKLGIAPTFMNDIFQTRAIPNEGVVRSLRSQTEFYNYKNPKTVYYGTETLRSLGPIIWNILPGNIKLSTNFFMFKTNIKCPCRLCKPYIRLRIYLKCFCLLVCLFCFLVVYSQKNKYCLFICILA